MVDTRVIGQVLKDSGGYRDLDEPVILASGTLGTYFINTEKVLQDDGVWQEFGDDAAGMVRHAIHMMDRNLTFDIVIKCLAEQVRPLLPEGPGVVISGGQRRDWIFSGPVAHVLGVPHVGLYKQDGKEDRVEIMMPGGDAYGAPTLNGLYAIHVVDLITEGSSVLRVEDRREYGWVPMLQTAGAEIHDVVAVVDRLQGGKERLKELADVDAHSSVDIDEDYLNEHSTNPERAIAYSQGPEDWTQNYLREHGALALITTFDPKGGKLPRARRFVQRYGDLLKESGHWKPLEREVRETYRTEIGEL